MSAFAIMRLALTLVILLGMGAGVATLLKRSFPQAWRQWGRNALFAGIVLGAIGALLGVLGRLWQSPHLTIVGSFAVASTAVGVFTLILTAPVWAGAVAWVQRRERGAPLDPSRRNFISGALGAAPLAAAASGPVGATSAVLSPVVRRVDIPVSGLPRALDGLRIAQMTDIHLGAFIGLDQVEAAVEAIRRDAPNLVVLTGDIADDLTRLPRALELVASLQPSLGSFAIYGNHEIYRGRERCRRIYEQSPVRLLVEEGMVVHHQGEPLWIAGSDDPATLGRDHRDFLGQSVARAMSGCPSRVTTRILLSHRPEGFEEAARRGVTLTLAGHTHGAQAAIAGRSWLEWLLPRSYLLGHYQQGASHLYTSAGLGHWFPFRLNCPCEVALVTLRRV